MTKNEVIKELQSQINICESMIFYNCDFEPKNDNTNLYKKIETAREAIKALEEAQEYRKLGTAEDLKSMKENGCFSTEELVLIRCQQMELEKYKKLGTVEEVREAVVKSHAQNIIYKGTYLRSHCPSCHKCIGWSVEDQYCRYCGQKLKRGV